MLSIKDSKKRRWYEKKTGIHKLSRDQLVRSIQRSDYEKTFLSAAGESPKTKRRDISIKRPEKATYVYKAMVEKVIDGDTLLTRIDLGFQVWKEQRIRLAEIDAPALDEAGGKKAFQYVRDQLSKVEFVMIKTNKIDIYGRYVGHVFYSEKLKSKSEIFSQGNYLNQELVEKGLAGIF